MFTFSPRKIVRLVSVIVMVALMFTFVQSMAQSYFNSMKCITNMSVACETLPAENTQMVYTPADNDPNTDEWLCSTGETSYCGTSSVHGIEVVQLKND